MERKYSLAYLTIPGTNPVDQIAIAAQAGYDMVSLRPIPMYLPNEPLFQFDQDKVLFQNIKDALLEYRIEISDIELARVRDDLDITKYESAFEAAAELGAKDVISSIWTDQWEIARRDFKKICSMAQKYGLYVNLEFVSFSKVNNLQKAIEFLDQTDCDNAHLLVDTLYAFRSQMDLEAVKKLPSERFRMIHLCDAPSDTPSVSEERMIEITREGRLYPGDGGVDITKILRALPKRNISIELPNTKEVQQRGKLGHARECLRRAKQFMECNELE
ncbi:MAG: sugar phosphate isomerase/epimerase [Peptostreptococcaceae bacterium]|nr:sugar phosphate isomerase/epimerase [Peptostreptococcaceae bacterium]